MVVVASGTTPAKKGQLQTSGLISHHFWLSCCQWHPSRPPLCSIVSLLPQKRPGKSMSSPLTQLLPNRHTNQIQYTGLDICCQQQHNHVLIKVIMTYRSFGIIHCTQSSSFVLAVVVLAKLYNYGSTMTILLDNDILRSNEGIYCNLLSYCEYCLFGGVLWCKPGWPTL